MSDAPSNGHGGPRPGAGGVPRDLHAVIDYRKLPDGTQQPVTTMERIVETMAVGGFLHDAAARIGVTVETLRDWRRQGTAAIAAVQTGRKRRSHLSKRDRQYAELAHAMEQAEAEARLRLLGLGQRLAQGGQTRKETTIKTIAPTNGAPQLVETTERDIEAPPDSHMITWLLAHRWPADFATRTEHTGPEGTPLPDPTTAIDRLRQAIQGTKPTPTSPNGTNHHPT